MDATGLATFSVIVRNTGAMPGAEVVQLYIGISNDLWPLLSLTFQCAVRQGDRMASVVRYERMLMGFKKVFLNPDVQAKVVLQVNGTELAFYNRRMELVVESGYFDAWIGSDCLLEHPAHCLTASFYVRNSIFVSR